MDTIIIDSNLKEIDFSDYKPIIIYVDRADNGDYSGTIQTSNNKMIEMLGDLTKMKYSIKIIIGKQLTLPDEFFGYIKIQNTKDMEEDLKEFTISVKHVNN